MTTAQLPVLRNPARARRRTGMLRPTLRTAGGRVGIPSFDPRTREWRMGRMRFSQFFVDEVCAQPAPEPELQLLPAPPADEPDQVDRLVSIPPGVTLTLVPAPEPEETRLLPARSMPLPLPRGLEWEFDEGGRVVPAPLRPRSPEDATWEQLWRAARADHERRLRESVQDFRRLQLNEPVGFGTLPPAAQPQGLTVSSPRGAAAPARLTIEDLCALMRTIESGQPPATLYGHPVVHSEPCDPVARERYARIDRVQIDSVLLNGPVYIPFVRPEATAKPPQALLDWVEQWTSVSQVLAEIRRLGLRGQQRRGWACIVARFLQTAFPHERLTVALGTAQGGEAHALYQFRLPEALRKTEHWFERGFLPDLIEPSTAA